MYCVESLISGFKNISYKILFDYLLNMKISTQVMFTNSHVQDFDSCFQMMQKISLESNKSLIERNAPWAVAFLIGILTVITNIFISVYSRKRSLEIANAQIKSTESIAIRNIENAQKIALNEFKSTLKTKNRQEWINELRLCISEFTTNCKMLNIQYNKPQLDAQSIQQLNEKVTFFKSKIFLLINLKSPAHQLLLENIQALLTILDKHYFTSTDHFSKFDNLALKQLIDKVIECGRDISYEEWQKVQSILD